MRAPPRVGYVLKVFPRLSQTFVVNEIRAHEEAGFEVTIYSLRRPREEDRDVVDPPLRSRVRYLDVDRSDWAATLAQLARGDGIGHLHAHFGNVAAETARRAAAELGIPWSFTAHALDIFDDKVDPIDLRRKLEEAAAVVTISEFNVRHLLATYGRRAVLVPNGMPLSRFPYDRDAREPRTILAIGRLIEKKGFAVLVDACRRLAERGVPYRCEIIGSGPLEDDLRQHIADAGLEGRIALAGALRPDEVRARLSRATLLAAPCVVAASGDRDGLPTVILEAMACGTPCVSTDVTGIPEVIVDGETGLVVPQHDAEALADACERLLAEPGLREHLARSARTVIEARFDSRGTSALLRETWSSVPERIVFRIHNRRGLGHWMRSLNIARELLTARPGTRLLFYSRSAAPFALDLPSIEERVAPDPDAMDLDDDVVRAFQPGVIVDDTILPGRAGSLPSPNGHAAPRRVFVMRKSTRERQQAIFDHPDLRDVDVVVVPHSREEFGHDLPTWLAQRTIFVGPIVRRADPAIESALRTTYRISPENFVLVSTPGGGGFEDDAREFFQVVDRVQALWTPSNLRHIVVRGPRSNAEIRARDARMVVVDVEPELASLLALADAAISAGGYNTVSEIRLARVPAFFIPGERKYDDQRDRVEDLARRGLAWVVGGDDPDATASTIAATLADRAALARARAAYSSDDFVPGNRLAAEAILRCSEP